MGECRTLHSPVKFPALAGFEAARMPSCDRDGAWRRDSDAPVEGGKGAHPIVFFLLPSKTWLYYPCHRTVCSSSSGHDQRERRPRVTSKAKPDLRSVFRVNRQEWHSGDKNHHHDPAGSRVFFRMLSVNGASLWSCQRKRDHGRGDRRRTGYRDGNIGWENSSPIQGGEGTDDERVRTVFRAEPLRR